MWSCPDCGRRFATTNQAHACTEMTLEEHLEGRSERALALYEAVVAALDECGSFRIHPQKTRVAFIKRMTFASVHLAEEWVDLSLITATAIEDERVRRLDLYGPTSFSSRIRLTETAEIDASVTAWMARALERGRQESLDAHAHVEPLTGRTLEIARVGFRSRVLEAGQTPTLWSPRYAAEALATAGDIIARIRGREHAAGFVDVGGRAALRVALADGLQLAEDDSVDVHLSAVASAGTGAARPT